MPSETQTYPAATEQLIVHFIDVGQGDAIFIQTPEQNILIDGGEREDTVVQYLENQSVTALDLVVGTHPHSDHIGGLINVLEKYPVKEIIDPAVVHTTKTFEDYLTLIEQKGIKFTVGRSGMSRDLGGNVKMTLLHPGSPSSSDLNNASIVTKITFGQINFLLAADAEESAEQEILAQNSVSLASTILKLGHHGSITGTTPAFLTAVSPEIAVIMCGKDNKYSHPHEETLQKLTEAGVKLYRTDLHGTIVITTNGQTYAVSCSKETEDRYAK
ncbi:MAG: ComEC/Rec2 family competence protein [Dethiobacteria bacterium]